MNAEMLAALSREASNLDPGGTFLRFEVCEGYQGSMKEHDRCAYLVLGGVRVACARRYGSPSLLVRDPEGAWVDGQ